METAAAAQFETNYKVGFASNLLRYLLGRPARAVIGNSLRDYLFYYSGV